MCTGAAGVCTGAGCSAQPFQLHIQPYAHHALNDWYLNGKSVLHQHRRCQRLCLRPHPNIQFQASAGVCNTTNRTTEPGQPTQHNKHTCKPVSSSRRVYRGALPCCRSCREENPGTMHWAQARRPRYKPCTLGPVTSVLLVYKDVFLPALQEDTLCRRQAALCAAPCASIS